MDTADGKRAIESLRVGDLVWSKNESSGAVELKPITQTFERTAPSTLALTFSNGEVIETTAEHPFYREGDGFIPAGLLAIGNSIVTRAGPSLAISGIEKKSTPATVYNFSVEGFHTYFVGNTGLWVHNANCLNLTKTAQEVMQHYGWNPAGGIPYLVDKNLSAAVASALKAKGYNVISVEFGLGKVLTRDVAIQLPDSEIIELMNKIGGTVITKNIIDFQGKCNAIHITGGNETRKVSQVMTQLSTILGFPYP